MFNDVTYSNRMIKWIQLEPIVTSENLDSIVKYLVSLYKKDINQKVEKGVYNGDDKKEKENSIAEKKKMFRKFAVLSGGRAVLFNKVVEMCANADERWDTHAIPEKLNDLDDELTRRSSYFINFTEGLEIAAHIVLRFNMDMDNSKVLINAASSNFPVTLSSGKQPNLAELVSSGLLSNSIETEQVPYISPIAIHKLAKANKKFAKDLFPEVKDATVASAMAALGNIMGITYRYHLEDNIGELMELALVNFFLLKALKSYYDCTFLSVPIQRVIPKVQKHLLDVSYFVLRKEVPKNLLNFLELILKLPL